MFLCFRFTKTHVTFKRSMFCKNLFKKASQGKHDGWSITRVGGGGRKVFFGPQQRTYCDQKHEDGERRNWVKTVLQDSTTHENITSKAIRKALCSVEPREKFLQFAKQKGKCSVGRFFERYLKIVWKCPQPIFKEWRTRDTVFECSIYSLHDSVGWKIFNWSIYTESL